MRILITTGGSGGHIFPSLGLADQLQEHYIVFAGSGLEKNRFFNQKKYPFYSIPSATFKLKNPLSILKGAYQITKGIKKSIHLIQREKPEIIIGFGSFHTLPVLIAASLLKIPFILHEANAIPGRVNALFSSLSRFVAIQFPDAALYLRGTTKLSPLPLREGFFKPLLTKDKARASLNLDPYTPTLLVFGGSQGAHSINQEINNLIPTFENMQVIHLTGGSMTDSEKIAKKYHEHSIKCLVIPFYEEMQMLYNAADLILSRAGASTIAEMIHFSTPAILIPYPFAIKNHQEKNGEWISKKMRGAVMIKNEEIASQLGPTLRKLLNSENKDLAQMKEALLELQKNRDPFSFKKLIEKELL